MARAASDAGAVTSSPDPVPGSPVRVKVFIFDTGTTGKNPAADAVTALAAVEYAPSLADPAHFSTLVKPWHSKRPPASALAAAVPRFADAWALLAAFVRDHTPRHHTALLIAHHAPFDAAFVLAELKRAGLAPPRWLFADSLPYVRNVLPPAPGFPAPYALSALAEAFDVRPRREHHAGDDVRTLRAVLLRMEARVGDRDEDGAFQRAVAGEARELEDVASQYVCEDEELYHGVLSREDRPEPQAEAVLPYVTTRTGRFYHMNGQCQNLRFAKKLIRVERPGSHLSPCYLCCDEPLAASERPPSPASVQTGSFDSGSSAAAADVPEPLQGKMLRFDLEDTKVESSEFYTTLTGRLYHRDAECGNLRSAKKVIPVDVPAARLSPCVLCCKDEPVNTHESQKGPVLSRPAGTNCEHSHRSERDGLETTPQLHLHFAGDDEKPEASAGRATYYTTKTGHLYHLDMKCLALRAAKSLHAVTERPAHLAACGRCCEGNGLSDNSGGPEVRYLAPSPRHGRKGTDASRVVVCEESDSLFDRKTEKAQPTSSVTYYMTRTGRFFHENRHCRNLRSAKSVTPVNTTPPSLRACYLCCSESDPVLDSYGEEDISVATSKFGATSSIRRTPRPIHADSESLSSVSGKDSEAAANKSKKMYITTRTGRFYHTDGDCRNLRSAKKLIPVDVPPGNLAPCYLCCGRGDSENRQAAALVDAAETSISGPTRTLVDATAELNSSKPVYEEHTSCWDDSPYTKESSLPTYGTRFVKATGGKKFHLEGCRTVARSVVTHCRPAMENRDPCRVCLLELFQEWEVAGFTQ